VVDTVDSLTGHRRGIVKRKGELARASTYGSGRRHQGRGECRSRPGARAEGGEVIRVPGMGSRRRKGQAFMRPMAGLLPEDTKAATRMAALCVGARAAPSHAAFNAELLLDILHAVKHILKLTPMHHLIEIKGFIQKFGITE
jgi:hypothetical protein